MYIRKGVRHVHVTSQLLLSKGLLHVDNGDFTISELLEPVSVFTAEDYPDPTDNSPTISYSQPTTSRYRKNSSLPDSLQRFITAEDELITFRDGPTTCSMTLVSLPPTTPTIAPSELLLRLQMTKMTYLT